MYVARGLLNLIMDRKHNKSVVPFAKKLRKNMTKEECHLWYDFFAHIL